MPNSPLIFRVLYCVKNLVKNFFNKACADYQGVPGLLELEVLRHLYNLPSPWWQDGWARKRGKLRGVMPQVLCCNHLQRCKLFYLKPNEQFQLSLVYWLEKCRFCGHTVLCMQRLDYNNAYSSFRKTNLKARKLFAKLKPAIDFEYCNKMLMPSKRGFYLHYSEYGTIKKCFSNFSSLQLGKHAGIGKAPPQKNEKLFFSWYTFYIPSLMCLAPRGAFLLG